MNDLTKRLGDLERLRRATEAEIERVARLVKAERTRRRRSRHVRPNCGTEEGYQWHRYRRETWPLPDDDPCGCRRAHADHNRHRDWARRAERSREDGAA